jgi:hypothetical protein
MILTVEGPSAAGKTTWVYEHFDQALINDELRIESAPGREASPKEVASFWAKISKERWSAVSAQEAETGMVVCDSDPFKLHYVWSLWRIGKVGDDRWRAEMLATRKLFADNELGISDLMLVYIPNKTVLESHARSDPSRSRLNFKLHAQLSEPLREWYEAIQQVDPIRVLWEFPQDGIDGFKAMGARKARSGTELFDKIMDNLPAT